MNPEREVLESVSEWVWVVDLDEALYWLNELKKYRPNPSNALENENLPCRFVIVLDSIITSITRVELLNNVVSLSEVSSLLHELNTVARAIYYIEQGKIDEAKNLLWEAYNDLWDGVMKRINEDVEPFLREVRRIKEKQLEEYVSIERQLSE